MRRLEIVMLGACLLAHQFSQSGLQAAITGSVQIATANTPLFATHAPGDQDHLYVAERSGTIRILDLATRQFQATPFLSIPSVDAAGEGGFLGLAFHPDYATNGKFYAYVTVDNGGISIDGQVSPFSSVIREYSRSASNPLVASPTPRQILSVVQPYSNHNGGWIGFNPALSPSDPQYLYIMFGDGGSGGDPHGNGQRITGELLGKVLRLDVNGDAFPMDAGRNYAIPPTNPFVGETGDDEIWAYGVRNPYRSSFDRETGDLWIADVGEQTREEVNRQLASSPGGENYGWRPCEGTLPSAACTTLKSNPANNVVDPIYDYSHIGAGPSGVDFRGNSVTGGYVYRGPDPDLQGQYFFADFVSDNYWRFDSQAPTSTVQRINSLLFGTGATALDVTSFAEDSFGNLYFMTIGGGIYRINSDAFAQGDYNLSGTVDGRDFLIWQRQRGTSVTANSGADGNGDGMVNDLDLAIWQDHYGEVAMLSANQTALSVPEPMTIALFLMAGGCAALIRRKH